MQPSILQIHALVRKAPEAWTAAVKILEVKELRALYD